MNAPASAAAAAPTEGTRKVRAMWDMEERADMGRGATLCSSDVQVCATVHSLGEVGVGLMRAGVDIRRVRQPQLLLPSLDKLI